MKQLLFLSAILILASACKDDVIDFDYDPGLMHYDGPNANAPILPVGTNEAAAKFHPEVLDLYEGKQIEAVELFIYNTADLCELVFYGSGGENTPGTVLFQQDVTAQLDTFSWNTVQLNSPLAIPSNGDLWISLKTTDTEALQVIGCDAGPNREGGDWLYQSNDGAWRTFRERSPDNINWNMRAVIF